MILVTVFKKPQRLIYRFPLLLINGSAGCIGQAGSLAQILVAVVQAAELWPFIDDDVHSHGIAGYLVLRNNYRTGPITVEWLLHPFGVGCSVHIARAVGAVNQEQQCLLPHVLMRHPIHEGLVDGLAVTFVLTYVVVCILSPQQVNVCCSIPVLGGQGYTRACMRLEQSGVNQVVGINIALYAVVIIYISMRVGDAVMYGFSDKIVELAIIPGDADALTAFIMNELGRGVSSIEVTGEYTGDKRKQLKILCSPRESFIIKRYLAKEDPKSFVSVTSVKSVWGRGRGFSDIRSLDN